MQRPLRPFILRVPSGIRTHDIQNHNLNGYMRYSAMYQFIRCLFAKKSGNIRATFANKKENAPFAAGSQKHFKD